MMHAPTPDGADCGGQALCVDLKTQAGVDVAETAISHTAAAPAPCHATIRTRKLTA